MAKYFTTEELFECYHCHIECARREMIDNCHVHLCPNCKKPLFGRQEHPHPQDEEWTSIVRDPAEWYPTPRVGIAKICYIGRGQISLPLIHMEDVSTFPIFCSIHDTAIIAVTLTYYEANRRFGCGGDYKLPGADIVPGGGAFVTPVTEHTRVWIENEEIDLTEHQIDRGDGVLWEYFL